jgi:hypothetical protein
MNIITVLNFAMITCLLACERTNSNHYTIKFANKSENPVYITYEGTYPDTLPVTLGVSLAKDYRVESKETNTMAFASGISEWETIFKCFTLDTLMVYVFDANKVDSLLKENPPHTSSLTALVRRYDLSLSDIQKMNWVLYYPPTENMKDIKMYPAYGQ